MAVIFLVYEAGALHGYPRRTMAGENGEVVRRAFAQAMRGEYDGDAWSREVEIVNAEGWVIETTYRGPDAVRQWWEDLADAFDELRIEIVTLEELDDERVLTQQRFLGRFRATELDFDGPWASVQWVRDGSIVRAKGYLSRKRALRDLGLPVTPPPAA